MTTKREILESPLEQGTDESIIYSLTTTPWGSTPSDVAVKVFSLSGNVKTDVTTTVMPTNTPTVLGDVISLSPLKLLTAGIVYRVEIKFTCSSNIFETYAYINCVE
jgi:hypothetical protein